MVVQKKECGKNINLNLKNGIIYSQKVRYNGNLIEKDYFVKNKEKILAYPHCVYRRFNLEELKDLMKRAGFVNLGKDKTNSFCIFKKK